MTDKEIFLFLGIIVVILLFLNAFGFLKKNKNIFLEIKKRKYIYHAKVIDKRHYNDNERNLFYVKFLFNENEEEYLVPKYLYDEVQVGDEGELIIKDDYFEDFK